MGKCRYECRYDITDESTKITISYKIEKSATKTKTVFYRPKSQLSHIYNFILIFIPHLCLSLNNPLLIYNFNVYHIVKNYF